MATVRIVTDLSYGDAGKGTTVDYLARQASSTVVVRHNGGPQAAHNVVTPDGRHHTFAQFGSGSFVPGVRTHLSEDMLVNPLNMFPEAEHLTALGVTDIWRRVTVDRRAKLITPWHVALNRLRERSRAGNRHGSCAHGVGEVMADDFDRPDLTLRVDDLDDPHLAERLQAVRRHKRDQALAAGLQGVSPEDWQALNDDTLAQELVELYGTWCRLVQPVNPGYLTYLLDEYEQVVFEGAQGVLLDEWRGFHPYTTWSTTTPANARRQLTEAGFDGAVEVLGIIRAYTTRHGPGPFVTEDTALNAVLPEPHNATHEWQGVFRRGHFDAVAHRYAIRAAGGVDQLVVTGLDMVERLEEWRYADAYQAADGSEGQSFFDLNADGAAADIKLGPFKDLGYQQRLGAVLASAVTPRYCSRSAVSGEAITAIEESLQVPVGITSFGPTAADKHALVTC